uniref:hypothetical protein n=1 Tax=Vibrio cholerae TaxID=666 RepID=UPI00155E2681
MLPNKSIFGMPLINLADSGIKDVFSLKIITILSFLFCLASVFPFLSPYPINTDTQPLSHIFAILLVMYVFISKGLKRDEILILFFPLFTLIYINPFSHSTIDMGKYLSLVLGIFIFVAVRVTNSVQIWSFVKFAVLAYFITSIIILIFPNNALTIQSYFVREINVSEFGHEAFIYRGVPALATEPGLLGGMLIFLLIQVRYFQYKFSLHRNKIYLYNSLLIITILMTRSGTGYLYLFLFFIISLFDYSTNKIRDGFLLFIFIFFCGIALGYIADTVGINK